MTPSPHTWQFPRWLRGAVATLPEGGAQEQALVFPHYPSLQKAYGYGGWYFAECPSMRGDEDAPLVYENTTRLFTRTRAWRGTATGLIWSRRLGAYKWMLTCACSVLVTRLSLRASYFRLTWGACFTRSSARWYAVILLDNAYRTGSDNTTAQFRPSGKCDSNALDPPSSRRRTVLESACKSMPGKRNGRLVSRCRGSALPNACGQPPAQSATSSLATICCHRHGERPSPCR